MCAKRGGPGRAARARGFTLLEVIVALAIAALALVGLFRAGSDGIFETDTAARTEEAIERAQSHLAAFGRTGALVPGELEGEDGGGYHWRLRESVIAQQPAGSQSAGLFGNRGEAGRLLTLYDIEVTISWQEGRRHQFVVLDTRRLTGAPASE